MKIDLAVYTAIHGYDWQPGTVYSTSDLVRYKRGIGRLPDPLMEELPFGGVFNDGDTVVFYRYHMAVKSDAKGRDSLYLVLGTLPKSEVGKVDFRYLFALSEFAKPLKPAPILTTYIGSAAIGTPPDFSVSFRRNLQDGDALSEIGSWFSHVPDGTLSMRISGTYANPIVNVQYDKPRIEEPKPVHSNRPEATRQQVMPDRPVGFPDYNPGFRSIPSHHIPAPRAARQNLLLPVLVAFLLGGIVGWYVKVAKDWISDMVKVVQENKPSDNPPPEIPPVQPSSSVLSPGLSPNNRSAEVESSANMPSTHPQTTVNPSTSEQESAMQASQNTSDMAKEGIPDSSNQVKRVKDLKNEKDRDSRR